ncbi:TonB-dependent receptor [Flavobacterium sp. IB48]|uniref:TonB-dependent receptor n=1 Tax=Flavobacterium sp. IB48 TaxID=2779375 RepID=UPI0018E7C04D|nr:TonB-dependent receptor [Flavobacterium sp. IB48]MBJ2126781.1 TonB-dependent receptor [Flavobacterium sp. IB48]
MKNKSTYGHFNTIITSFILLFVNMLLGQNNNSINGLVFHSKNPLSHATVILEPSFKNTVTDSKGHFSFSGLSNGTYTIRISNMGYKDYIEKITLNGAAHSIQIEMEQGVDLKEVNVTSRIKESSNPENLVNARYSAMPVTVIDRKTIELMGSRRLDEVLKEQTGIAIVNNISGGARSVGVQMQGFGSEYIMVLIDGQPMVGRNNGNFDLSRISVSNIERIEIIKGASSSLYGSEALGGTINIITRHGVVDPQMQASVSYGSLNIVDATLEGETPFLENKGTVNLAANYYRTDGYNTNSKYIQGTTSPPYDNYSLQGRSRYQVNQKSFLGLSGRYGLRRSFMEKDFGLGHISGDNQDEQDLNLSVSFDHRFNSAFRSITRYYLTYYTADMSVAWQENNSSVSQDVFKQTLHRLEQQFSYSSNNTYQLVGGFGGSVENMNDVALNGVNSLETMFSYVQGEWTPFEKLKAVGGLRYDHTNNFGGRLNPSFGLQYFISPKLTFKTGVGTGFKAPDFKTNYLVFYNSNSNYLVIGNAVLAPTLEQLQKDGQISEVRQYVLDQTAGNLQAEKSTSYNAGLIFEPSKKLKVEGGGFYHRITNQINSIQVATGSNNRIIYTYQNLPEAVNKGFELSLKLTPIKNLEISAGYQYLIAKDLSIKDSIRAGKWPYSQNIHDPATGNSYKPRPSDYWGIENRSRHMANSSIFYRNNPWKLNANLRVNFRGKYPFGDRNGNQFIDKYDIFVKDYWLINASIDKQLLNDHLNVRFTADNIFDYTDPLMPGQPGRILLLGVSYRFFKNQ